MTKDKFEVIEMKLAELYQLQWDRIKERMEKQSHHYSGLIREEIAEAREILDLWMCCIEAKERARRRFEAKAKLD